MMAAVLDWITPEFGPAETALTALVASLLMHQVATCSPRRLEQLYARIEAGPAARTRAFRATTAAKVLLAAITLEITVFSAGVRPADLGLRPVTGAEMFATAALTAAVVIGTVVTARRYARNPPARVDRATYRHALVMRPRTPAERRWAPAAALAEAVAAPLVHQGLLIAAGVALGLPVPAAALISAGLWGLTSRAFGFAAVTSTTVLALVFTFCYATFGSLLVPMVLYAAVQLSSVFLLARPATGPAEPATPPLAFAPDSLTVAPD